MKTENERHYSIGFVLTEQELRRIHQLIIDQLHKHFGSTVSVKVLYEIKYRNGSTSEPNSLDTIFAQENIGSLTITRLKITFTDGNYPSLYNVSLGFTKADLEDNGRSSVFYRVIGNDRDWVFILTSLLDERINRIKRFSFAWSKDISFLAFAFFGLSLSVISVILSSSDSQGLTQSKLKIIEENYKNGRFKDPIEALIEIEKHKLPAENIEISFIHLMSIIAIPFGLVFLLFMWSYFFPAYNLCWGEYINFKKRRESMGKFLFSGIVIALTISITANYISALLGIGK